MSFCLIKFVLSVADGTSKLGTTAGVQKLSGNIHFLLRTTKNHVQRNFHVSKQTIQFLEVSKQF